MLQDNFVFSEPEPQIMDYRTQQYKLFPNIAAVWCYRMGALWLWNMYNNVTAELESGDLDRLPEVTHNETSNISNKFPVIM